MLTGRSNAGFTLIELLIVLAIMGILVAVVMPSSNPSIYEQLRATSQILRHDLAYGRSLAVSNNSSYRFTFDGQENRYVLEHTGGNAALDVLPDSPFSDADDPADQLIVDLDELPHIGPTARIVAMGTSGAAVQRVETVEFGPLGETARSAATVIWLEAGGGSDKRYVQITINPVTGLTDVSDCSTEGPPSPVLFPAL